MNIYFRVKINGWVAATQRSRSDTEGALPYKNNSCSDDKRKDGSTCVLRH